MDAQTKAFQALKPICVALDDAAKSLNEGRGELATVTDHLDRLKRTLSIHTAKPGALHPKLAEYIFFPISQVLRVSQKASIQSLELCLQCISILVDQGWRHQLPPQTAAQLAILCTLLASKKPQGLPFEETTEELQSSAFWCLYHIFTSAGNSEETRQFLTTEANFPQLGQTISVTLVAIEDSARASSQAAASASLEALLLHVADREVHAGFLPGIFSQLTKTLTPSSKGRTSPRVLSQCLSITRSLLISTLGQHDEASPSPRPQAATDSFNAKRSIIDGGWQSNAVTQLRPALVSIMRLRSHGNREVQAQLGRLCIAMLRECQKTLANCSTIALETLMTICAKDRVGNLSIELEVLLQANASVLSSLQEMLYEWLQSLSTTMQSADEHLKTERMRQISISHELLAQAGADMTGIDRKAASALRDSVVVTLTMPVAQQQSPSQFSPIQSMDLVTLENGRSSSEFDSALIRYKGQERVMQAIHDFTSSIVDHGSPVELRNGLERPLRQLHGDALIANFWLLLMASERSCQPPKETNEFLDLLDESPELPTEGLDELYSFALTVLTSGDHEAQDARLQALALRALALRARVAGQDFRFELLDALYPVLHTLATPDDMLQRASITTLNILTTACGYVSVKDLIVENVDYLVNAVALKLNAFDVSPQAPQVLLMMLRLAGPTLLPYLEDTVESMFAALEDYHGYPVLVELLFKVLGVMVEEGVKTPQLAIDSGKNDPLDDDIASSWAPTTMDGLAVQLELRARDESEAKTLETIDREPHPGRPWGNKPEANEEDGLSDLSSGDQNETLDTTEAQPPAPRTYSLLLKITELTQHFLPSASTSLRTSLLGLIRTTAPALAKHENSFLPLINTVWPEVVSRLDDEETHVIATALDIVHVLCESAKDFMRTRIVQLWPRLLEIHQNLTQEIVQYNSMPRQLAKSGQQTGGTSITDGRKLTQVLIRMEQHPSMYGNTSIRLLWSALQAVIPAIVQHVQMPPEYIDEALEMLAPALSHPVVRSAFEEVNDDALWLALLKSERIDRPASPPIPHGCQWSFAQIPC